MRKTCWLLLALVSFEIASTGQVPATAQPWTPTVELCRAAYQLYLKRTEIIGDVDVPYRELLSWDAKMVPCRFKDLQHWDDYDGADNAITNAMYTKMKVFLWDRSLYDQFIAYDEEIWGHPCQIQLDMNCPMTGVNERLQDAPWQKKP
jgi:hypothetical protein